MVIKAESEPVGLYVFIDRVIVLVPQELRQVKFPDERRKHVGRFQVEVVPYAVEVRGHDRYEIRPVLLVEIAAELDGGYLGYGIGLVGRLQYVCQQILFLKGLRRYFRIDAGRPDIQQFRRAIAVGGVDDVGRDGYVVVDELRGVGHVGDYAAHLGRGQEDVLGRSSSKNCSVSACLVRSSSPWVRATMFE